MNLDHICTNCKSRNLRVRTSSKIGMLTIEAIVYCNSCGTEHTIKSQITKVRTPTYNERPEAMRVNKCLMEADLNTPDLFDGVIEEPYQQA